MIVHCLDLTHWLLILPKAGCCLVAYSCMLIGCIPCLKFNDDWLFTLPKAWWWLVAYLAYSWMLIGPSWWHSRHSSSEWQPQHGTSVGSLYRSPPESCPRPLPPVIQRNLIVTQQNRSCPPHVPSVIQQNIKVTQQNRSCPPHVPPVIQQNLIVTQRNRPCPFMYPL